MAAPAMEMPRPGQLSRRLGRKSPRNCFFATQLMHRASRDAWRKWNNVLRDLLFEGQDKEGHAAGSWYFAEDPGAAAGGRLYCTSLAALSLQTYYGALPNWRQDKEE
jgi:hypothetical protein